MDIRKTVTACIISAGLAFSFLGATPAEARGHHKVVVKRKHVHHRHRVGLKHIGRGTKTKTTVKSSTH